MHEQNSINSLVIEEGSTFCNRFKILSKIGIGGMGVVFLARDLEKEINVAIKILHPELYKNKEYVDRFVREIKLMSSIENENVVKIYDFFSEEGLIFFSMEYIEGETLEKLIEDGKLSLPDITKIFTEICHGLSAIHKEKIIHRDLKPANIIITKEHHAKITDFGVARPAKSNLTQKGVKIGSAFYMAPEVWNGKEPSFQSDLYTLGILLFEMLTGELPFDGNNYSDIMMKHLKEEIKKPSSINHFVPNWLDRITLKLTKKDLIDRFLSIEEVIAFINSNKHRESTSMPIVDSQKIIAFNSQSFTSPVRKKKKRKTYVLELSATKIFKDLNSTSSKSNEKFQGKTITVPLPKKAALKIKVEPPSRDVLYFGLFLTSLQIADGLLTSKGIAKYGIMAEGNPLLHNLFHNFSHDQVLIITKCFAVLIVITLSVIAKRNPWVKNVINTLSCIYLFAAIIPWFFILYF